jgi:hypothetical protein
MISLFGLIEIFLAIRIPFINADLINALAYDQWEAFKHWAIVLLFFFCRTIIGWILQQISVDTFQ